VVKRSGGLEAWSKLALTAFLASVAGTHTLRAHIFRNSLTDDEDSSVLLNRLLSLSGLPASDVLSVGSQRVLDSSNWPLL